MDQHTRTNKHTKNPSLLHGNVAQKESVRRQECVSACLYMIFSVWDCVQGMLEFYQHLNCRSCSRFSAFASTFHTLTLFAKFVMCHCFWKHSWTIISMPCTSPAHKICNSVDSGSRPTRQAGPNHLHLNSKTSNALLVRDVHYCHAVRWFSLQTYPHGIRRCSPLRFPILTLDKYWRDENPAFPAPARYTDSRSRKSIINGDITSALKALPFPYLSLFSLPLLQLASGPILELVLE